MCPGRPYCCRRAPRPQGFKLGENSRRIVGLQDAGGQYPWAMTHHRHARKTRGHNEQCQQDQAPADVPTHNPLLLKTDAATAGIGPGPPEKHRYNAPSSEWIPQYSNSVECLPFPHTVPDDRISASSNSSFLPNKNANLSVYFRTGSL